MQRTAPGRVVVGIDETLAGLRALRVAAAKARRRHAPPHAVRVWNHDRGGGVGPCMHPELERAAAEMIGPAFITALGTVPADLEVNAVTLVGPAGWALVHYADRDEALLVVGHSRLGLLQRVGRGSVARYCAAHAAWPVLVVLPDEFARRARRDSLDRAIRRNLQQLAG